MDRAAGHDHRPRGCRQQLARAIDERRISRLPRARPVRDGQRRFALLHSVGEHVPGHLQKDRSRAARQHGSERFREVRRNAIGRGNPVGPLGDPGEQVHLLHLLQRSLASVEAGRGAPEQEHGAARGIGIGDAGQRVGHARTRGDRADADSPGQPRRCVGGVRGRLLVPRVDDGDALFHAGGIDRSDVQPREGEEMAYALGLEHPHEELRTGRGSHIDLSSLPACPRQSRRVFARMRSGCWPCIPHGARRHRKPCHGRLLKEARS